MEARPAATERRPAGRGEGASLTFAQLMGEEKGTAAAPKVSGAADESEEALLSEESETETEAESGEEAVFFFLPKAPTDAPAPRVGARIDEGTADASSIVIEEGEGRAPATASMQAGKTAETRPMESMDEHEAPAEPSEFAKQLDARESIRPGDLALRGRVASAYGEKPAPQNTAAEIAETSPENATEAVETTLENAVQASEKSSASSSKEPYGAILEKNNTSEAVDLEGLKNSEKVDGIDVAKFEADMPTSDRNPASDLSVTASTARAESTGFVPTSGAETAGRAALLPSALVKIHEQVADLMNAGGGNFELEWGSDASERLKVQVALHDGRWRVEFRAATPEMTRFLEREWAQTSEVRNYIFGDQEAEVTFSADDSREDAQGQNASHDDLEDAEAALLDRLRRARLARSQSEASVLRNR